MLLLLCTVDRAGARRHVAWLPGHQQQLRGQPEALARSPAVSSGSDLPEPLAPPGENGVPHAAQAAAGFGQGEELSLVPPSDRGPDFELRIPATCSRVRVLCSLLCSGPREGGGAEAS